ncbi:MAG TPA: thiamine-phosphate kinase [Pyrinomonadaceae bacterium]|jgi:thiamine-monophosphate kinase
MNEFDFIRQLREQVRSRKTSARVISGIGDDAAVIRQTHDRDLVVSTDLLVENIDFNPEATPPRLLGHKALAVSLSDIAAMGARPLWSLVSMGLPKNVWNSDYKDEFFSGYLTLADRYGVTLTGGDISESQKIVIDSIVVGEVRAGRAVMRSTAQPGDQIFVTSSLGGAAAGLKLIERGARVDQRSEVRGQRSESRRVGIATGSEQAVDDDAIQALLLRQLAPQPRVGWGIVLGEEQLATAMIDISDGLSSDLHHLCSESIVGATIDSASLPLDENVKHLCGRRALDPLALALHGGEDFELLFTVAPENVSRLPKRVDGVPISHIGEITADPRVIRIREKNHEWDLPAQGFQHFSD